MVARPPWPPGSAAGADPLVVLSAIAGRTTRLRLATSVLAAPYYPALLLANRAAALDDHG
ncbi:LLM class flavin-dependent oxidoreductase [Nonomuraea pusilla]|uniref:LLM class flavin-dependent oxidoreductase n=1 Tax=Nonomuraea pusilla TaxID=46177 RepID=UPI001160B76E